MSARTRLILETWRGEFKRLMPMDTESRCAIIDALRDQIQMEERDPTEEERETLMEMLEDVEDCMEQIQQLAEGKCPLAFLQPSLEQAMIVNAWAPHAREAFENVQHCEFDNYEGGYRSIGNFAANRLGKTYACILDTLLWLIPNDPQWRMFGWMDDWKGRGRYRILPRPDWERWRKRDKLIYPGASAPPKAVCDIWHGVGRDDDWTHKVWLGYKRMMAPDWFGRRTDGGQSIYKQEKRFDTAWGHSVIGMSMSAESEKWSGKAAWRVNIDEGCPRAILDEGLTRITAGGYFHWAYTPVDPANIGEKTRVAFQCYSKPDEYPLMGRTKFFVHFLLEDAPPWIVPTEKKEDDLRRFKAMGDKGKPRYLGGFMNSSPVVFSNFDRDRNVLPWTGSEIRKRFPTGMILRGMDEGLANPTACVWCLVTPANEYVYFQEWEQSGLSVSERCERIVELSGNIREVFRWHEDESLIQWREKRTELGMIVRTTEADSKMFRRNPEQPNDDWTETYRKAGLKLTRASNIPPKARCDLLNDMLRAEPTRRHILHMDPQWGHLPQATGPGAKAYISKDCTKLIERMENYLWQQLSSGPNKGHFTDKPEETDDHTVDACTYISASKQRWIDMQMVEARRLSADAGPAAVRHYRGNAVTGYA